MGRGFRSNREFALQDVRIRPRPRSASRQGRGNAVKAGLLTSLIASVETGAAVALVTCTATVPESRWAVGQQSLVWTEQGREWKGDLTLSPEIVGQVKEAIRTGQSQLLTVEVGAGQSSLFVEVHARPCHLLIVGAGHIAVPLARLGTLCDFSVTVLDDRPQFANPQRFPEANTVMAADFIPALQELRQRRRLDSQTYIALVTRGHQYDVDCLTEVLDDDLAYVGMIGSKRRIRAVFELLQAREGIPRARFKHVHAPIGLNIGAQTPAEIAVCIMAEIINCVRHGPAPSFRDEL